MLPCDAGRAEVVIGPATAPNPARRLRFIWAKVFRKLTQAVLVETDGNETKLIARDNFCQLTGSPLPMAFAAEGGTSVAQPESQSP